MKKYYLVVDEIGADVWSETYTTREKATEAARATWDALTDHDKKRRGAFYILETDDPDGIEGNIIKSFK